MLHSLTIALKDNPAVWTLLFRSKEAAEAAYKIVTAAQFHEVSDDFGQHIYLPHGVSAALLENLDESSLAHVERAMHSAHTQAKANSRANSDPILRSSIKTQGPAILSPMQNGRGY